MKAAIITTLLFIGFSANALTLNYTADYANMSGTDSTSLDICGYPQDFSMDAKAPLAPTFIKEAMFTSAVDIENIQASEGSISGGYGYSGDYREKVYIVKQKVGNYYLPAIYYRVQVTTYGSTTAPHGFVVATELLNHRSSAELAEGAFCGDIYYKLK